MKTKDFFNIMVRLEIPEYQNINTKKNTASENSLTFNLGRFYSFTFHSRHGKDRGEYVDKANIAHLKAMLESIGVHKGNFWELAAKYSKREVSVTQAPAVSH